jgi:surface carbohydrate biosynthesis protein
MPQPRIALLVDQPQRDLPGLVLTAYELCQRGGSCYLVPANHRERELWALAPDCVVLYCARHGYEHLVHQLLDAGIGVVLLDAEGGVWQSLESYGELLWKNRVLLHQIGTVCIWGPKMASYVISQGLFLDRQIAMTGCPRFDLYHPSWRRATDFARQDSSPDSHTVLINTNFADANPRFATAAQMRQLFVARFGWNESRYNEWLDVQRAAVNMTISMCSRLARDYPSRKFVLRPHPFEGAAIYHESLGGFHNIHINTTGPVQNRIFEAVAVIQRSCTTAIESAIASVPALSPQWIPTLAVMEMAEAVSVPCLDYEELRSQLDSIFAGSFARPPFVRRNLDQVIADWFYCCDGRSYQRAADAIWTVSLNRSVNLSLCRRNLFGIGQKQGWASAGAYVRYAMNLSPDWSFRHMKPMPGTAWLASGQYYDKGSVDSLCQSISGSYTAANGGARPVSVRAAAGSGGYRHDIPGYSVSLSLS